jgi:hypothetical protein
VAGILLLLFNVGTPESLALAKNLARASYFFFDLHATPSHPIFSHRTLHNPQWNVSRVFDKPRVLCFIQSNPNSEQWMPLLYEVKCLLKLRNREFSFDLGSESEM